MLLKLNVHLIPDALVTTGRGGRRTGRGKKKRGAGPGLSRAGTSGCLGALGKPPHCRLLAQPPARWLQSPVCPGQADLCAPQNGTARLHSGRTRPASAPSLIHPRPSSGGRAAAPQRRPGSAGSASAAHPVPPREAPQEEQDKERAGGAPRAPARFHLHRRCRQRRLHPHPGRVPPGFAEVSGHLRAALPVPEPGQGSALRCPRPRREARSVQDRSAGG